MTRLSQTDSGYQAALQPITAAQRRAQLRAQADEDLIKKLREAVKHYEDDLRKLAAE